MLVVSPCQAGIDPASQTEGGGGGGEGMLNHQHTNIGGPMRMNQRDGMGMRGLDRGFGMQNGSTTMANEYLDGPTQQDAR